MYIKIYTIVLVSFSYILIAFAACYVHQLIVDDNDQKTNQEIYNFESCLAAGYQVLDGFPRQCCMPDGRYFVESLSGPVEYTSKRGVKIELNDFQPNETISSPLKLTGKVPGNWSFEAVFSVMLTDWDGKIIAESQARVTADWMTDELVPFEAIIEFEKPIYKDTGTLILRKDNPSDLPAYDDALEIQIVYN